MHYLHSFWAFKQFNQASNEDTAIYTKRNSADDQVTFFEKMYFLKINMTHLIRSWIVLGF